MSQTNNEILEYFSLSNPGFIENDIIYCAAIQMVEYPKTYHKNQYGSIMLFRNSTTAMDVAKGLSRKFGIKLQVVCFDLTNKIVSNRDIPIPFSDDEWYLNVCFELWFERYGLGE